AASRNDDAGRVVGPTILAQTPLGPWSGPAGAYPGLRVHQAAAALSGVAEDPLEERVASAEHPRRPGSAGREHLLDMFPELPRNVRLMVVRGYDPFGAWAHARSYLIGALFAASDGAG